MEEGNSANDDLDKLDRLQREFEFWGGYNADEELLKIIDGLQLEGIDLDAEVNRLSGGQKVKVSFARVLYSKPEILLLDEPTNHLDQKARAWLSGFLRRYQGSILIISHDVRFLDEVATKIVRLDEFTRKADVFKGNYSQHLKVLGQMLESQKRAADNQSDKIKRLEIFVEKMRGTSGKRKRQVKSREKALEKLKDEKIEIRPQAERVRVKLAPRRSGGNPALVVQDICFSYRSGRRVLEGLSFSIARNERLVIVGKNGAGKSTLLKVITGTLEPQRGEIRFGIRTDVSYYAQEHDQVDPGMNVLEEAKSVSKLPERNLRSALAQFLFKGEAVFQKVSTLSPGERSRLALAKLSLQGGNLLLLDEPTNHLDSATSAVIAATLRDYGGTIIVVSHDINFLDSLGVERMLMLPQGRVRFYERSTIEQYRLEESQTAERSGRHAKNTQG